MLADTLCYGVQDKFGACVAQSDKAHSVKDTAARFIKGKVP